jgi:hypothetical protein
MSQRLLSFWALLTAVGAVGTACSSDYNDDAFGVLEFKGTPPTQILAEDGFEGGARAQYYNFGDVASIQNEFGEPLSARVNAMYFFFTPEGKPLMAPAMRELRTRQDFIVGGNNVVQMNPKDFCAVVGADPVGCKALNDRQLDRPYSLRYRELLIDADRGTANYQRPIVDVSPTDITGIRGIYSGAWEIVEVTVPSGYQPDAIKHRATLKKAIESGDFKERRTGKVVNCPFIDERTEVTQGVADASTPRPRMEIWYRNKLAFCYLADGWLTLGDNTNNRYPANSDALRLDTFDVSRVLSGQGVAQETVLVVPVGKAFVPTRVSFDEVNGISGVPAGGQIVTAGRPRKTKMDPTGYTPIRWLWEINFKGELIKDSFKDAASIDQDGQTRPKSPTVVRNLPLRGVQVPCSLPKVPWQDKAGKDIDLCGRSSLDAGKRAIVDASGDPACNAIGLECNKTTCFCDSPPVKFGQRCGEGIARCDEDADDLSADGYTCFPSTVGFCYMGCDPYTRNKFSRQNRGREPKDFVDSRCKELRGYSCFPFQNRGICLRFCDENVLDTETMKQCQSTLEFKQAGVPRTVDLGQGQQCRNFGLQICSWPDDYSPRN